MRGDGTPHSQFLVNARYTCRRASVGGEPLHGFDVLQPRRFLAHARTHARRPRPALVLVDPSTDGCARRQVRSRVECDSLYNILTFTFVFHLICFYYFLGCVGGSLALALPRSHSRSLALALRQWCTPRRRVLHHHPDWCFLWPTYLSFL